jgi:hypothetical protein
MTNRRAWPEELATPGNENVLERRPPELLYGGDGVIGLGNGDP